MRAIPPKPEGSRWTNDQWEAVVRRGENILVAAAAGSGKTAVLVERIIKRITDEADPVDVDRLLVATFTKAAAAEMRHRIREALEKELLANPESDHLRRQLALMNRAAITTLHSFCLDVIRRYHHLIHLDPGFRIAGDNEAAILRQETWDELLEECYADSPEDSPFWELAEWFGGEQSDAPLAALLQRLYDASRSHPFPDEWLTGMAARFAADSSGELGGGESANLWFASLIRDVRMELRGMAGLLQDALRIVRSPGGPAPYAETLEDELALLRHLQDAAAGGWRKLHEAFQSAGFGRLKACKGGDYDPELQEKVKELRDAAKEKLGRLKEELFQRTPEQYAEELRLAAPLMGELVRLVGRFADKYARAKADKGLVDFNDLEHYCLAVLLDRSASACGGKAGLVPSAAALSYREQFVEVLLDEYQDTNRVQEAIVELISRPAPGNRFMVGDVKQSIYRFRLAEPGLFLDKHKAYGKDGTGPGRRIDLARNFRSRRQVTAGVNFLFRQMMNEAVGEIEYDESAELVCGAAYPEPAESAGGAEAGPYAVELALIDRSANGEAGERDGEDSQWMDADGGDSAGEETDEPGAAAETGQADPAELETAQLEARYIAAQIRRMTGADGEPPFRVAERSGELRPATYRDFVVLLRATQSWAPVLIEELGRQGIPAYADISAGYFAATEVETVLSLLKVIDNPYQDIPLAAVLRSPLVGLAADDLARIRLKRKQGSFYDALVAYIAEQDGEREGQDQAASPALAEAAAASQAAAPAESGLSTYAKAKAFAAKLESWRRAARTGPLSELIWSVYRETGYYDYVGGLPGGAQRQANLRALYDRARQYEATSFRGLFRFLRFVERMRESGSDLGTARALGEQEDVVRIMSIHKSKGLEFPVVFVAGLGKLFNLRDLNGSFLIHKDLGFGPRFVDARLRVSYPTLPQLAIKRRLRLETLAEEMRVLYVALTRPKEKLFLIGTVAGLDKKIAHWARQLDSDEPRLPDHELAQARCYLDWIGPAVIRHRQGAALCQRLGLPHHTPGGLAADTSEWRVTVCDSVRLAEPAAAERREAAASLPDPEMLNALRCSLPLAAAACGQPAAEAVRAEIVRRLSWRYPYAEASALLSKTTVSELKRLNEQRTLRITSEGFEWDDAGSGTVPFATGAAVRSAFRKPAFLGKDKLSAGEKGTVYHAVMQHLPTGRALLAADIAEALEAMAERRLLTSEQCAAVDPDVIAAFFATPLGQRYASAKRVLREVPFSCGLKAKELYPELAGGVAEETVLIQGVIDCLFEDEAGLVLLDYKTDATRNQTAEQLRGKYRIQLELYRRAVERIWKRKLADAYVFFFDGPHIIRM